MSIVKGLFGGGSLGVYLVMLTAAGGFYFHYKGIKKNLAKAEARVELLEAESSAKSDTIASQARQNQRKADSSVKQQEDEDAISSTTDSNQCSTSEPIIVTLERLRDEWQRRHPTYNPDE